MCLAGAHTCSRTHRGTLANTAGDGEGDEEMDGGERVMLRRNDERIALT